eukprot:CAMPEP_0179069794 /NCGR_PEP_ID=MMETSP0796-20121207/30690_1 /TAXON_ID=73915 /ORGANISM="Pyrodinium bahamense, Strain pbaha01" /LENGTH=76 /DNA_ID=CAMNT_0020766869 /DNA_START=487 /DNA_END=713 /DNA_ORIENTATION=+
MDVAATLLPPLPSGPEAAEAKHLEGAQAHAEIAGRLARVSKWMRLSRACLLQGTSKCLLALIALRREGCQPMNMLG